jgi:hypothetical protein
MVTLAYLSLSHKRLATASGTLLLLLILMQLFKHPQEPAPGYISAPGSKALARARFLNELPFLLNQDIKSVRYKFGYPERVSEITGTTVTLVYKFAAKGTTTKSKQDYLNEPEVAIKFCRDKVDSIKVIYPLIIDKSIGAIQPNTALYNELPNIVLRHNLFTYNYLRRRGFLSPLCHDPARDSEWEIMRQHLLDLGHLDEHEIHTVTGLDEHIYQPNAFLKNYATCGKLTFQSNEDSYCSGLVLEYIANEITDADFHRVNGRLTDVTISQQKDCCIFWSSAVIEGAIMRTLVTFAQSQDLFGLYKESLESLRVIQNHITSGD